MNHKTVLSAPLLATATSMSAGVFATDNGMPMTSEVSGAHKMKSHSRVAEKVGASAASALAAAPAGDTKGRNESKRFHSDTK